MNITNSIVIISLQTLKKDITNKVAIAMIDEAIEIIKKHEELEKDVKRYFELIWVFKNTMWVCEEDSKPYLDEYTALKEKLQKVGEK